MDDSTRTTKHRNQRQLLAGSALLSATVGLICHDARAAEALEATASDASDAPRIEEVIVTARKREESLQDVPVAMAVLSSEALDRYDMSSLERIAASTPQFTVARASNGSAASLSVRGIGSSFTSIGIEQSVAVIVDGVYYGQGRVINEGFFDLQRVELLKGPQALFYGKNGSAGVVSAVTADPGTDFEAYARVGYETEAEQPFVEGVISGAITDTLSARLAVRGSWMNAGYVKNVAGDEGFTYFDVATGNVNTLVASAPEDEFGPSDDSLAGRATLLWAPGDNVTNTTKLAANATRTGNAAWNYVIYDCPSGRTPCGHDFVNAMNDLPAEMAGSLALTKSGGELYNDYDSYQITNTTQLDFSGWGLTSVLNYQDVKNTFSIDADYFASSTAATYANERDEYDAFSAEFRAQTAFDGPFNFMIGGLYQETTLDTFQVAIIAGLANSGGTPEQFFPSFDKYSGTDGETLSIFAQATFEFLDQFEFSAGARYTDETKDSDFEHKYVNPAITGIFVPGVLIKASQSWDNVSPEATLSWKPNDDVTAYVAYKTGYKSGGFSNSAILGTSTTVDDFTFDPEESEGFEVGLKSRLLDGRLNLGITYYDYTFDDLQVEVFNSTLISFNAGNAGSSITRGVEFEFQWLPETVSGLSLGGSINYNKSEYEEFTGPCYAGQTIGEGCDIVSTTGGLFQNLNGAPTAVSPDWTGNLSVNYALAVGSGDLDLSANARYSDDYSISQYNNPSTFQSSYTMFDAAARLAFGEGWEVALIGRNLTDEFVIMGTLDVVGTGAGTGTTVGVPADQAGLVGLPRTVQVQVTKRF